MAGEIADLRSYKFAKVVVADMAKIIPRVEACIVFLKPYRHYAQVESILDQCNRRLELLKAQNNRYVQVVKNKGKR